jgi:uncharacterized protein (TIGR02145 family)
MQLYSSGLTASGCTDSEACNFNASASCDDGTCIYPPTGVLNCEVGEAFCAEGTNWNSATQSCDPLPCEASSDPAACGPGTYWDELDSLCLPIETCTEDLDGDGVIGVNDLMQLLSSFGSDCPEAGDPAGDPATSEFTCGDPVNYHGYDYATVQIGEQCWFAENLRTESYRNGDAIPGELSDSEWSNAIETLVGAQAVYNNDTNVLLEQFGRLYNWFATTDPRHLCPNGWHVPSDAEWQSLESAIGLDANELDATGHRGTNQGSQLKSSQTDLPSWNGLNSSGFSALPGGYRHHTGAFLSLENDCDFWTSTDIDMHGWFRGLYTSSDAIFRSNFGKQHGFSVRCLKDE